ncbi:ATP-binding protein [Evansella tamaricis]|uniref:histidine kinase n=1 Tax=Evansella tamaricis TaxID=2069301 RepID=A0ABS6JM60_9BACI|nr:ATP-binding protein [Evansella tamaricis]MBU9714671.1 response regulator [Evansella tamaricis]
MYKGLAKAAVSITLLLILIHIPLANKVSGDRIDPLILDSSTEVTDLYPALYMIRDNDRKYEIQDVANKVDEFIHSDQMTQKSGFFESHTWLRFEIHNESDQEEWLLEFAFPLIYELNIYSEDESGITELQKAGAAIYPFSQRDIEHRNFIFNIEIDLNETKVFYVLASGGGELHPPINIWNKDSFIQKTQTEFTMLGLFYGVILVMILYNLFLYFSLKLRSYLYYVIVMICTLMGKLSINGLGFQYLWSNYPEWNIISTPLWVSLACIFILVFTRSFLDVDQYIPKFKNISYVLMGINGLVIISLLFSQYIALYLMLVGTLCTFVTVISTAFLCLERGARQARFFIVGWLIFLVGVFITILQRAVFLPFSMITEYAGQGALTIEVVLLSLALADKINIMRDEKEKAEQRARESQELAMKNLKKTDELKDEFLAITSHELRTPLYGMIGIAESLRDGAAGNIPEDMKRQLNMIITSGNRLTHLVNDILDFSKLKHESLNLHIKPVYIKGIVDVVISICKSLVNNRQIQLVNMVDKSLPPLYADQNRLQQILYNLIGNAIKYTEEGEIVVSASVENGYMKISVSDTGKGITEENKNLIFEPFQQVDKSVSRIAGGAGIGLSITKRLVDLHGGKMEVESELGEGSTFHVLLPLNNEQTDTEEEVALTVEAYTENEPVLSKILPSASESATIVIADDEPVNLQILINQLTLEGYEIITASHGEEVFRIIQEYQVDLLILDIMMPNMSGYEVCQRLREDYSLMELPILMLTAKNQLHDKIASFEAGANDYLVKPCDKQELISRVKTLVRIRTLNQELIKMNLHLEEKIQERTDALKFANDDLKQMNEDLLTMAESRRRLLSNIAHELGTPVTLIHGYLQALQEGLVTVDDNHYRKLVFNKIKILNRLIDDLSDLSRLEAGKASLNLKDTRIDLWLEQVYQKFSFEVSQGKREFHQVGDPKNFKRFKGSIDVERMDQVISNLISNAIKNTSEVGGKISITSYIGKDNNRLTILIKDNGVGISEEDLPKIFDRFYKGKTSNTYNNHNGTGLGLAIVKEIVLGHKGEIWAESEVNEGSKFFISIPICAGK